jgi:hypothetical protein
VFKTKVATHNKPISLPSFSVQPNEEIYERREHLNYQLRRSSLPEHFWGCTIIAHLSYFQELEANRHLRSGKENYEYRLTVGRREAHNTPLTISSACWLLEAVGIVIGL